MATILIVDDSPIDRRLVKGLLEGGKVQLNWQAPQVNWPLMDNQGLTGC